MTDNEPETHLGGKTRRAFWLLNYFTFILTGGIFQEPSRIDGSVSARPVEAHHQDELALRGGQPVGFLFLAWRLVLHGHVDGKPYDGANSHTLTFPKGEL